MRKLYWAIVSLVFCAFLASVAVLIVPDLTRDPSIYATTSTNTAPEGELVVSERPDLLPALPASLSYSPDVPQGTETYRLLDGVMPRSWVGYRPEGVVGPSPAVILFHGAGRPAVSMIDMWQAVAEAEGLTLISINQPSGGWDVENPDGHFIHAVLADASDRYDIDHDRVFLFGHSAGAIMAQMVGNRVTGPWRGVATHAGYVNPAWLYRIADAPPMRQYLGTSDGVFNPADARLAATYLARAGHEYELILIPGHTHWFYVGGPAFAADAWAWFDSL